MHVYVGAITATYQEPQPPLYLRPEPLPREGNMGDERDGVTVFELDRTSGALHRVQAIQGLRNPTFLALHPSLPLLYAAERETTTWGPIEAIAGAITTLGDTIALPSSASILKPAASG
jgi:6-phosphogluconolactonase (cycloisomerase 2 family)